VNVALAYNALGQNDKAEASLRQALSLDPANSAANLNLGMLLAEMGKMSEAEHAFRAAFKADPKSAQAAYNLGIMLAKDQPEEALTWSSRAAELRPDNPQYGYTYAFYLYRAGQLDEALKVYQQLASDSPRDPSYRLWIARIYRAQHDFPAAEKALATAQLLDADNLEVRDEHVVLLESEGKIDEALTAMKALVDTLPRRSYAGRDSNARGHLVRQLAFLYREAKQYPAAIDAFREYATLDTEPADEAQVDAAVQIVATYRAAGDLAAAEREAQAATKKFADNRDASRGLQLELAEIYEQGKRWNEMTKALDRADQLASKDSEKETVYFMRGAALERQKKYDLAETAFRKVLELNPKNAGALNYFGYMLADRNMRLEEAYDLIKRAVDLDPENAAYLDSLGWVYFRQGKLDDARGLLERALDRVQDATVHDHLGDVYLKLGKTKEAIAQWQDSLREFKKGTQQEADPDEVSSVNRKLDEAQAKLAAETHAK